MSRQKIINDSGFKLDRFEVYNWGTFDDKICVLNPDCFSALLTGENGSGKSTLVDALLTLLVPNVKRNYNLASGNEKKERTELTYMRGAYGREQNELGGSQTKFLRKEESYSVLLAKFRNAHTFESITIGQFFWFEQATLHKLFFISHSEISIQEHFSQIKNSKEVRNRLKNILQTTIFTTFTEYQAYFIRYVGLRSEKGLDLFNQITAIKEINRLDEFVRKHMLNANETQDLLNSLYTNYQNLELAYKAILLSKNQLDELNPLKEEALKFDTVQLRLTEFQNKQKTLPFYFAKHKKEALLNQQSALSQQCVVSEATLKSAEFKLTSINERKLDLMRLLSQDKGGQELDRLRLMLNQLEEKRKFTKKQSDDYAKLAKTLGLCEQPSLKEFAKNLSTCQSTQSDIAARLIMLKNQHYSHKKEQEKISLETDTVTREIQSLKTRKNRLPINLIQVRDELAETLNISTNTVPFIAELMKVQDQAWEGAIEKLLHTFALRMLVPQDLYTDVCKFLNRKNIGIRLVFQKVDETLSVKLPLLNQIESNKLFHKLEFKSKSPYVSWLKEQIIKNYDYACVEELSVFQKQFKAITPQGLIKHGANLNEKDDRFSLQDKNRFVLGWDNREKLDWLLTEIQNQKQLLDKAALSVQQSERAINQSEMVQRAIQTMCTIVDFSIIDWRSLVNEIDALKKRQAALMNSNQKIDQIQKDLSSLENDMRTNQSLRDNALQDTAVASNAIQELAKEISYCEKIVGDIALNAEALKWIDVFMKKKKLNFSKLTPRDYNLLEKTTQDELNSEAHKTEVEKQRLQAALVRKMAQFKSRFSEQSVNFDTTLDSLPGYLELQQKLQAEALPEHERRFKKLLSRSVMNDMAAFKSTLELAYEDIEDTISELNHVLIGMNYSDNSYVQLEVAKNKDVEIREFHHLLKYALQDSKLDGKQETGSEVYFERIKTLLDRLKNEERWSKKVIDVRNWADFSVLEKSRQTNEIKNYYSDSAGLSGGQKAKLAFTILGSSIAYQYGLNLGAEHATEKKSSGSSFRFI